MTDIDKQLWDTMWQKALDKFRQTGQSSCSDDDLDLSKGELLYKEIVQSGDKDE